MGYDDTERVRIRGARTGPRGPVATAPSRLGRFGVHTTLYVYYRPAAYIGSNDMYVKDGPIRVLHLDDDREFVKTTAVFLEREDERFDVETATDSTAGLERLATGTVDCVVSDYDMPGDDGIGFLERVRESHPDLPFILYTGKGSEAIASEAVSAGVTDYLQKGGGTSQYTVLANRIRNVVEKHDAQTELADREKRLSLFFEQSPLGVVEWDEGFHFVRQNDAAEEILGYPEDELTGRSWRKIVPASELDSIDAVVGDLVNNLGRGGPRLLSFPQP